MSVDQISPYPDGACWDEAWRQRRRADSLQKILDDNGTSLLASGYAFRHDNGEIDLESVADTEALVREKLLSVIMGWRYGHSSMESQEETWSRMLATGKIVAIDIYEKCRIA